jgi:hypothetical protein
MGGLRGGVAIVAAAVLACGAAPAMAASAQSKACSAKADEQGLHGQARVRFRAKCLKGGMSPSHHLKPTPANTNARAVTEPSGMDPTERDKACDAEAGRKGLEGNQREAFRKKCLATAGPVAATGTTQQPATPTPAKPGLGEQQPH